MFSYLLVFLAALASSLVLTPLVRVLAVRNGWMDRPDGKHATHLSPVPRIGGAGIFGAMVVSVVPLFFLDTAVALHVRENPGSLAAVLALAGLMMLVGVWDDLKSISPWQKISAQVVIALLCWFAGFRILQVWGGEHIVQWGWLSLPFTVLWIVVITNAFNLIDGMDGLASGAALCSTLALLVFMISGHQTPSVILLAGLAGAAAGFLRYNFHPASIFLGDSGSLLLGFMLAIVSIMGSQKSTAAFSIAVPVVALGLPVVDTVLAVARRFVRGRPIFSADKRHIHHLLVQKGLTMRHAVVLLYGICGLFGLFSICFISPSGKTRGVILAILGFCVWFGLQKLRYSELSVLKGHVSRGVQNQRKLLAGGVVVQHIVEGLRRSETAGDLMAAVGSGLQELCFSKFEIAISQTATGDASPGRNWEVVPLSLGGTVLRWTSPCRHCERLQAFREAAGGGRAAGGLSPCAGCDEFSNPVLQKSPRARRNQAAPGGTEYQIAIPLRGADGVDMGMVKLYYPARDPYPVSAIAILSAGIGREFEESVRRVFFGRRTVPEQLPGGRCGAAVRPTVR